MHRSISRPGPVPYALQLRTASICCTASRCGRFKQIAPMSMLQALPGGSEPDFILVTCAGTAQNPDLDAFENAQFSRVKRSGEDLLRQSGLGYVIVRPADLLEEPGGYKALIFDQVSICQPRLLCARVHASWLSWRALWTTASAASLTAPNLGPAKGSPGLHRCAVSA